MNEGVRPAPTLSKRVFLSHPVRASTLYNKALEAKQSDAPVQHYSSYESIAFEEPDGPGLRRHYRAQSRSMRIVQELLQYFLALIITLAICWLYIFLFFTSEKLADLRIETFAHSMEQGHTAEAVIFAIWTCLLAALIPATIILVFAPGVIGSGMVQLIAFLNGANSITKSTLLNMFARFFGVFGIATAGLYSGVDGPMAMIGASLAIFVVHCIRRLRVVRRWFYGERKDTDDDPAAKAGRNALFVFLEQSALRLYATLGAAVAISAIFRSPIGGVMFTLEETLSFFEPHIMVRTLFCTVIAFLVVGYEFARHLHSWTDVRIGQNSESWEITLFPTNVQCSRTNPLNAQTLLLQLLGWAAMGVCMAIVGTVWNRLLSAVQKIRTPYTLKFLDTQFANRASEKSSTTELETGKQSITQKTLNTLRNRSEMKFAGHSSKRWLFGTIRLFEVAVVCIITTLVVVLLPRTPGVDQCVPLSRTTAHVALRTPTECFQGVGINATSISDASLQECLEGFGGVCLPPDLKNVYQQSIIHNFYGTLLQNTNLTVVGPGERPNSASGGAAHLIGVQGSPSSSRPLFDDTGSAFLPHFRSEGKRIGLHFGRRSEEGFNDKKGSQTSSPAGGLVRKSSTVGKEPNQTNSGEKGHDMKVSGSDHEGSGKVGIIRLPTDPDEIMLQMEEFQKLAPHTDLTAQHAQVDTENDCYFQIRSLLYTTPERQLKLLLTRGLYLLLDIRSLGIFLAVYLGLSLITYYIALPTDLVIPNLIMGAVCGRICAVAWNQMMPALMIDPGFIALIGMAGLWAATSRLTLTVIVICFELTGDFDAIPALIIVSFVAAWVSSFLGESLYHLEMHNNHTPYLPSEPSHHLRTICVRQIMSSRDLVVVTTTAKLSACVEAIESGHNGFPVCEKLVVEDSDRRQVIRYRPVGFVYRDLLHETTSSLLQTAAYDPAETRLDLTTLMNVSPTIVREDATAAKVFSVLRSLGLRHIIVVDRDGFLVGLVTRKDLVRAMHHPHDTKTKRKRFWRRRDNRDTDSHQDKDDDGNQALRNRKHTTSTGPRQEREGGSSTLASGSSHSVPRPEMTKIQDKEQQQMGTTSTSTLQTTHDLQSSSTRMGFETPPESSPLASTHNSSFNLPLVAPSDPTSTPSTGIQLSTSSHGRTFDPKDGTLSRDFHVLHPLPGNVQPIRPPLRFTPLSNSSLKDTIIQPTRFDSLQSDSDFDSDDEEDEQLADIGDPPAGPPLVPRLSTRGWRRHEGRVLDGET